MSTFKSTHTFEARLEEARRPTALTWQLAPATSASSSAAADAALAPAAVLEARRAFARRARLNLDELRERVAAAERARPMLMLRATRERRADEDAHSATIQAAERLCAAAAAASAVAAAAGIDVGGGVGRAVEADAAASGEAVAAVAEAAVAEAVAAAGAARRRRAEGNIR
jgi:hypothetical protein